MNWKKLLASVGLVTVVGFVLRDVSRSLFDDDWDIDLSTPEYEQYDDLPWDVLYSANEMDESVYAEVNEGQFKYGWQHFDLQNVPQFEGGSVDEFDPDEVYKETGSVTIELDGVYATVVLETEDYELSDEVVSDGLNSAVQNALEEQGELVFEDITGVFEPVSNDENDWTVDFLFLLQ